MVKPHDWSELSDVLTDISQTTNNSTLNNSSLLSILNADEKKIGTRISEEIMER